MKRAGFRSEVHQESSAKKIAGPVATWLSHAGRKEASASRCGCER